MPDVFTKAKRAEVRHGWRELTRIEFVQIGGISVKVL